MITFLIIRCSSPDQTLTGSKDVLEVSIVKASGEHVVLNEYTNPEYFWAVRGGGGSAWGVSTIT